MEMVYSLSCEKGHPLELGRLHEGCPQCQSPAAETGIRRLLPSLEWVKGVCITFLLALIGLFVGSLAGKVLEAATASWLPVL